ncbi:MAG TPA: hypothetical protein VKB59_05445 [Micromonosporaceae bacterium]|nr:hypothetical protein [Micromonosporaceae bacterium]
MNAKGHYPSRRADLGRQSAEWDELFKNWWEFQRRFWGSREERKRLSLGEPEDVEAAHDTVAAVVRQGGPEAVALLVALNDAGPPDDDGGTVGCGLLETLIHEHGDALVDVLDDTARTTPSFARAMSYVWLSRGHLLPETEDRLARWIARPAS